MSSTNQGKILTVHRSCYVNTKLSNKTVRSSVKSTSRNQKNVTSLEIYTVKHISWTSPQWAAKPWIALLYIVVRVAYVDVTLIICSHYRMIMTSFLCLSMETGMRHASFLAMGSYQKNLTAI